MKNTEKSDLKEEIYQISILEVWTDWANQKTIQFKKSKYSQFMIQLRYDGERDGSLAWWLKAGNIKDGKIYWEEDYNLCYRNNAVKCFLDLPIRKVETYDNINGLRRFFEEVGKEMQRRKLAV